MYYYQCTLHTPIIAIVKIMATPQVSEVVNAVGDLNAEKLVFSDNKTGGLLEGEDKKPPSDTSIDPKDFYWDQILFYLVSAILGLSFLDISVEFFRGSVVQCFIPDGPTRDQVAYLNNYCYGSLPDSQYYLIFILISALLIIAPHYMWNSYFGAHFDFFFDLVRKLDRLRDTKTGEYNPLNFELVKKLEKKFCKFNTWIFRLYKLKLISQLVISIVILLANWFYFSSDDFNETFSCPANDVYLNSSTWPLEGNVSCVYNSLNLLWFLRMAAFGLVSASILFIIIGIVWCFIRHSNELGAKEIAEFCDVSCLVPEEYTFPSARNVLKEIMSFGKDSRLVWQCHKSTQQSFDKEDQDENSGNGCSFAGFFSALSEFCRPRICNDLDFLLMKLYFADSGHGQVFKDIQIHKEIQIKNEHDHELLHLLNRMHLDYTKQKKERKQRRKSGTPYQRGHSVINGQEDQEWERIKDLHSTFYKSGFREGGPESDPEHKVYSFFQSKMGLEKGDWSQSPLRSVLYGFLQFAPDNKFAIDISFGTPTGYSLVLAKAFFEVITIHFNRHYQNPKEVCRVDKFQNNVQLVTYPTNIFSHIADHITKSEKLIYETISESSYDKSIDMILIGPMTERAKLVSINLLIEKLYFRKYFTDRAILMAIRPLMIGAKPRTEHFRKYKPPEGLFEDISETVKKELYEKNVPISFVSPRGIIINGEESEYPYGIEVVCNDIRCIFEIHVYQYIGRYTAPPKDQYSTPNNDSKVLTLNAEVNPSNQTNGGTSSVERLPSSLFQGTEISSPNDVRSPALLQEDVESKTNDPQPDEDKLSPLPQRSSTTPPEYMNKLSSNNLSPPHQCEDSRKPLISSV